MTPGAVAEGFGGEPGIARGLLEQCSKRVPELVWVKRRDVDLLGELAAIMLRTGNGEPVGAGGLVRRLQTDEQRGGVVFSGVEVVLDRGPGIVVGFDSP